MSFSAEDSKRIADALVLVAQTLAKAVETMGAKMEADMCERRPRRSPPPPPPPPNPVEYSV